MYKIILVYISRIGLKYNLVFDNKTNSLKSFPITDDDMPVSLTGKLYNTYSLFSSETKQSIINTIKRGMKTFFYDSGYIDVNIVVDPFIAHVWGITETTEDAERRRSLEHEIQEFINTNYNIGD